MQSMSTETKEFPQGLRILLVDNDFTSLRMIEEMSLQCQYQVTTCSEAIVALNLLREMKGCFDLVLIDANIPDMDGFEFVKRIQFEMNLPVIIMSSDDRTSAVMKALKNGACDYLIKPVRREVLRNIWQHVWKRKLNENKEHENSGCFEDNDRNQYTSLSDQREVMVKLPMKRSNSKEDEDGELVNDDPPASKKPRVVWSVELHQQFVSAVKELGLDKAVPKRILELMNIPGLTRENVASHLQKYRLYLKRQVSEEDHHQQNGMSNTIGYVESKLGGLGSVDIEALAAAGQVSPQTLALQTVDQASLLHASIQRPNNFPHSIVTLDDAHSGLEAWSHSNAIGSVGPNGNLGEIGVRNKNILLNILHQQRLHQQKQQQQQLLLHNQSHSLNTVQPSCLLVPSQSTGTFLAGNSSVSVNHSSSYGRANAPIDSSSFFAPQSNGSSSSTSRCAGGNGYRSLGTISPSTSLPSCSSQQLHNSTLTYYSARPLQSLAPNHSDTQGPYGTHSGDALEQAAVKNLGFVGKGTCIPSSFSALEIESSINDLSQGQISVDSNGNTVNEPNIDLVDNPEVGIPVLQRYSSLYHMSMFPE